MTIKKRLAQSNIAMLVIPLLTAAMLLLGLGAALLLLRENMTTLHDAMEQMEGVLHGCCMALADSVPGVSGGTVAFILGFYDRFINALHDLFGRNSAARKTALLYLFVHYPSDILAGALLGMAIGLAAYRIGMRRR